MRERKVDSLKVLQLDVFSSHGHVFRSRDTLSLANHEPSKCGAVRSRSVQVSTLHAQIGVAKQVLSHHSDALPSVANLACSAF
jgi:hypothetical protein